MPAGKQVMDLVHLLSPYFVREGTSVGGADHATLINVTANQHHNQVHAFWGADHSDVNNADVPADGEVVTYDGVAGEWVSSPPAAGGHDIEVNTIDQNDRANLNFADGEGIDMSGSDDAGNDRTTITADLDVPGLAAMSDADPAADYLLAYDTSAGVHEKLLIANLPWPSSGGAAALGVNWDGATTEDGITKNAVSVAEPEYVTGRITVQEPLLATLFTVDLDQAGTYDMYFTSGPYDGNVTPQSDILFTVEAGVVSVGGDTDFTPSSNLILTPGVYYITLYRTDGGETWNITQTNAASEQGRGCALFWTDALWFDGTLQTADWPVLNLFITAYLGDWQAAGGAVYSDANVSDPPQQAEITAAYGSPAAVGAGFIGVLDDNGAGTDVYFVWTDGVTWFWVKGGDASDITYTPAVLADWDGGVDPGNVDGALDQLAERVTDLEAGGGGGTDVLMVQVFS